MVVSGPLYHYLLVVVVPGPLSVFGGTWTTLSQLAGGGTWTRYLYHCLLVVIHGPDTWTTVPLSAGSDTWTTVPLSAGGGIWTTALSLSLFLPSRHTSS